MNKDKQNHWPLQPPIRSLVISLGFYFILRLPNFAETIFTLPKEHFYIVSLTSIIAAGISIGMGVSGARLRNIQVLFVALGFISLTILFSLHGLTTPGFLVGGNRVIGLSVQLSFLLMGTFLWLSTLPGDNRMIATLSRKSRELVAYWTLFLVLTATAIFFNNSLINWLPIDSLPLNLIVATITFLLATTASMRYWQSYRYTQFPLQSGLAHASILVAAAQVIASTGQVWHIGWWLYHFLLLFAVLLFIFNLARQFALGDTIGKAVQGLFIEDPFVRLQNGISPSIQALITAAEAHDTYTAGHAHRVALYALQLGEHVGLSPEKLRALVQGSLLHDIGKISVSDSILNKPGKLTEEERQLMQKHSVAGYEICKKLGFMEAELEIIRWHHERLNGRGYPDAISQEEIHLLVRIVSVVDIYDALTSDRAYRPAMSQEQAVKHLESYSGFSLQEDLVESWKELIANQNFPK